MLLWSLYVELRKRLAEHDYLDVSRAAKERLVVMRESVVPLHVEELDRASREL